MQKASFVLIPQVQANCFCTIKKIELEIKFFKCPTEFNLDISWIFLGHSAITQLLLTLEGTLSLNDEMLTSGKAFAILSFSFNKIIKLMTKT